MRHVFILLILSLPVLPAGAFGADHPDDIYWSNEFAAENGVNGPIHAIVEFNNKLIVAGGFTTAGGRNIPYVAAWDGIAWTAVGTPNIHGPVYALHVFGGQLYAGGCFFLNDSSATFGNENLAVLNGGTWQWVHGYVDDTVFAISDFNGHLVIGGAFYSAGGTTAWKVAWLDGNRWNRFENTLSGSVYAITTFRSELVVAGSLLYRYPPGGLTESMGCVARWNGTRFVSLNMGFSMINPTRTPRVYDLLSHNDRLLACGYMDYAQTVYVHNVASWDGSVWSALGAGLDTTGYAFALYRDTLMTASARTMFAWNGSTWNARGTSASGGMMRVLFNGAYGLYGGGDFTTLGAQEANHLARYHATSGWLPVTTGIDKYVSDIAVFDNKVFVTGGFTRVAQQQASYIAAWTGSQWQSVGWLQSAGRCLAPFNGNLYAGGTFVYSGQYVYPLQVFNGLSAWSMSGPLFGMYPVAAGNYIQDLTEFQGNMILAGMFVTSPPFLAAWSGGGGWMSLGTSPNGVVQAVTVYSGRLIAAGAFTSIGGISAGCIAAWDGAQWAALGDGLDGAVNALAVFNGQLIAAGYFLNAGGQPAARIAAWNGSRWSPLGGGMNNAVHAVTPYGSQLIAGGQFTAAGGSPVSSIAAWDGIGWSPLGSGVDNMVRALCVMDSVLYVGGQFTTAGSKSSPYFAKWSRYPGAPTSITDHPANTLPDLVVLYQNYPNPFNPATTIAFDLPRRSSVTLTIFNVLGQRVATLLSCELPAGTHHVEWDGSAYASGVYLYALKTDSYTQAREMVLVK